MWISSENIEAISKIVEILQVLGWKFEQVLKKTERQRDRETEGQRDRETERLIIWAGVIFWVRGCQREMRTTKRERGGDRQRETKRVRGIETEREKIWDQPPPPPPRKKNRILKSTKLDLLSLSIFKEKVISNLRINSNSNSLIMFVSLSKCKLRHWII